MGDLKNKKLFLLDMDGTLYLDNNLFDGTLDFLSYVKSVGGKYIFLTNNSSKGVDKYIEKLKTMGIVSNSNNFLTSADATIVYLKEKSYRKIYAFGTESFVKQLKSAGLNVTTEREEGIDCLCLSNDTELTFKKFDDACILLQKDIDYVATNPDRVCPTWYGFVPDCGSFADIIYNATKKRPKFIGKPEPEMAYLAMNKAGFTKEETVIIGDRLYTDVACGINAGISTIFVLSGEGTLQDVEKSDFKPDFIYENIRCIYEDLFK
ncbi:MAG: HAD-IIA family hydrolase [Ruminococcaceae bacterium]|nr:HAD-IIA family hydrolase [Oscillospiraceae bacterium]